MPMEEVIIIVAGIITLVIGLLYWLFAGTEAQQAAVQCEKCTGANDISDRECRYCQHSLLN